MEQLWNDMRTTVCETLGIEQAPVTVNPEEDEVDSRVQSLSEELDIDALNDDFKKFAGVDGMLSRAEFNTFIKMKQIPSAVAGVLWSLLDRDNSGEVSKDEFKSALLALRNSQSWSRYCPACEYRNDCAFCQECNSGCPRCSDASFCASCWNDHPGRQQTMEEQALLALHPLQPTVPTASSMPATPTALTTPTDPRQPRQPRHLCHLRHHMHPSSRNRTIRTASRTPLARPSTCERTSSSDLLSGRTTRERYEVCAGWPAPRRQQSCRLSCAQPPCQLATAGLPVQYKAGMRQMLADQKQKADAAAKEAQAAAAAD